MHSKKMKKLVAPYVGGIPNQWSFLTFDPYIFNSTQRRTLNCFTYTKGKEKQPEPFCSREAAQALLKSSSMVFGAVYPLQMPYFSNNN